jgi:hypothetical protein
MAAMQWLRIKPFEDMVSQRDREIVAVLNALRQARLM